MANITVTEAADFIPEIWAATALGYLKANTVMARLVNRNWEAVAAGVGDTIHIPKRGTLSVNNKTANGTVTLQTPQSDKVDIVLDKHKEISFLVEDVAQAQANQDIVQGYINDGIMLMAEQVDADLLALYTGFTATPIDALGGPSELAGVGVKPPIITSARRTMNAAKIPTDGRVIVWHHDAEKELLDVDKFTSAQYDPANVDALQRATLGPKFGFTHYMDQQVVTTGGECKNMAFHPDAMTLAMRPLPLPPASTGARGTVMQEDGFGIRILYAYNPSYLGVQVTLDILYGVKMVRPEFGVTIRSTEVA